MLLLLLAFPAALPILAPGYATPFGILMIVLGSQMLSWVQNPSLPETMKKRVLKYSLLDFSLKNGASLSGGRVLCQTQIGESSHKTLPNHGTHHHFDGCIHDTSIPLTNTAPSFVIFVMAASLLEKDG